MKNSAFKFLFLIIVTAGAVFVGYKFLSIRASIPLLAPPAIVDAQPVLTIEQLPEIPEEDIMPPPVVAVPEEPVSLGPMRDEVMAHIVDYLKSEGADVLDSKVFDTKALCDQAVKIVAAEYQKRGIPEEDMAQTTAFPGSTGSVMMLRNGKYLFYLGCITPENINWAVYVHFMPNATGKP